jgi:uncharacterized membrane protein
VLKFERTITLNAPVEQVFDYVADRAHLPTIWPSLIEVTNLKRLPAGGATFQYVYKLAGMCLVGTAEDTEYVAKERLVTKLAGDLEGTITFRFEPVGRQTKVQFVTAYTLPTALISKLGEPFVAKLCEHEAELVLQNLKAYFEVGVAPAAGVTATSAANHR